MLNFREWLTESDEKKEGKESYKDFFQGKLDKYKVKSPSELSDEDKSKFFDEIDSEWEGEKEEPEDNNVNEAKQIVDKKQLEWFIGLANKAKDLDSFIEDLNLMKGLVK